MAGFNNSWPAILHEYSDRAAYEDDPVWKAERAAESNWTKPRPSSIEIARMERAIVWPGAISVTSRNCFAQSKPSGSRALGIATSRMRLAGSVFRVGSLGDGIARASISLPRDCGAMRWRCSKTSQKYLKFQLPRA